MDMLHWILLAMTFISLGFAAAVLILAHGKIGKMKSDYRVWTMDAEYEIEEARRAMAKAQRMKAEYEMAGEALRGKEDYFDG